MTLDAPNGTGFTYAVAPATTTSGSLAATTALAIASGSNFDMNGTSQIVASLSDSGGGGGSIITSNTAISSFLTSSHNSGTPASFSGVIGGGGGTLSLTKTGLGTLILTGANTYTGITSINVGTLAVNGSIAAVGTLTNDSTAKGAANYGTFAVQQSATAVNLTWTPTPIVVCRNLKFGANAGNVSISGDFMDPDKDGLMNLMEYALGQNPNAYNAAGLPNGKIEGAYFTLTHTRAKAATDITLRAVWSTSLSGWSTIGITEEILADDAVIQNVKAKVLSAPDAAIFLRLEVTRP